MVPAAQRLRSTSQGSNATSWLVALPDLLALALADMNLHLAHVDIADPQVQGLAQAQPHAVGR